MKTLTSLFIISIASKAIATPRLDSDSIAGRHDLLLLKDSRAVNSPVLTWPWPLGRTAPDSKSNIEDQIFGHASERFEAVYAEESQMGFRPAEMSVALGSDRQPFRSYGYQPREQFEVNFSQAWLSEWFSGNLSFTFADNPADGDEFRLDGSYLAVALGNWSLALDQVDRWWGPGWDGSLILSNNARPIPAVSLTRISPDAFESKWLRWIGPWTFTTFMGQLDNEEPENDEGVAVGSDALLFGMRIDFSPFGWENLDIGLTRTAQWAGEGRPDGLDTFWKLLLGEDNAVNGITKENEPGNQLAGVDYRLKIGNLKIAQYGQIIGEDEETFLPDACMLLFGLESWGELNSLNATWRAYYEWADTRAGYFRRDPESHPDRDFNTAYNHGIYKTGYRRHNQSIGHAMDGDGIMRSLGGFIVNENGNLWGAKYRNYSLNRDGRGPNSVTIAPVEGQSIEIFTELKIADSKLENWLSPNLAVNAGLHYIDEENQRTGEQEDDFGGYVSILTSF